MWRLGVAVLLVAGCLGNGSGPTGTTTADGGGTGGAVLERVADGFAMPLLALPDPDGRLVVVEQEGLAWRVDPREVVLDVRGRLPSALGYEQGLLGLAYHPASPDTLLAAYSDRDGATVVARYPVVDGVADVAREDILLAVPQPFANHNGGHIAFGPDGMLYVGLGDGGAAGDPGLNGQNRNTLLGSLLRLHVPPEGPYEVPDDNPFVGEPGARGEIWAYGLRNPWRFSFDTAGDLWLGDVGQNAYEEIDHAAGGVGGQNYGWNLFEGRHHFPSGAEAPPMGTVFPVAAYHRDDFGGGHCSVTGGHVVRDERVPDLVGSYVFGDFCSGTIWRLDGPQAEPAVLMETELRISSFGLDGEGALLVVDHQGAVHRLAT